jgi:hypothetical protein
MGSRFDGHLVDIFDLQDQLVTSVVGAVAPQLEKASSALETPPIPRYLHDAGKSLFAWDCVVELGGLEPATKRLSMAKSKQRFSGSCLSLRNGLSLWELSNDC